MKLDLSEVEYFLAIISLPWSFKIIYGFMSDNIKFFNTKRKSHLIVNAGCCILSMSAIISFGMHFGKYFLTTMLFISQLNMAYIDTVIDALIV